MATKKTDLAYYAGFFDADGCIYISHSNRKYLYLEADVASTTPWILQAFKFAFGGNFIQRAHPPNHARHAVFYWYLTNQRAADFLHLILPYLNIKKPQAELAIKFQEMKKGRQGKRPSLESTAVKEAQFILMKKLKQLGKEPLPLEHPRGGKYYAKS